MIRIEKLRDELKKRNIDAFISSEPLIRRYLSGFTGSTGYAVISQEDMAFATDFRYFEQAALECPDFNLVKLSKDYTIFDYLREKQFKHIAIEETFMTVDIYHSLTKLLPDVHIAYGLDLINEIRRIKSADEIELHRESCEITNKIISDFFEFAEPGISEIELNDFVLDKVRKYGADNCFFEPITLTGPRTSLCHGKPTERKLQSGDFLLIDMGVNYKGHASDVTRTAVIGKASGKQKEIYNIVLEAHMASLEQIKTGMTAFEADRIARDIISKAGYGEYFNHALGHGFNDGLILRDNHAVSDTVLQENMVFTIEPGIYIPGLGGVRIEDDVVLTKDGCRSLCTYPKELLELDSGPKRQI